MAAAAPIAIGMQVAGQLAGGIEQNRASRAQARVDEENARQSLLLGEQEADGTRREERRMAGEMLAGMGGNGIELGTGSAADLLAESAYQRELEVLNIRTRRSSESAQLQQSAADRRKAGRAAIIGGVFGAGATALSAINDQRAQRRSAASRGKVIVASQTPVPRMTVKGAY